MTAPEPEVWTVPRESKEWVGPIAVGLTVNDAPVDVDPTKVRFAVLPIGTRPADGDWIEPVTEPAGVGIGVQADPVDAAARLGIWAKVLDSPVEAPVLEPDDVGYLNRT